MKLEGLVCKNIIVPETEQLRDLKEIVSLISSDPLCKDSNA